MCNFFSLVSDGRSNIYYFDADERQRILHGDLKKKNYETDSHTSIADYCGFKGKKEDCLNKYEFNPMTRKFEIDQLNTIDDSEAVKAMCLKLDFKTIAPQLIIKKIVNPFTDIKMVKKPTTKDIANLKKWASVRASVGDSVWGSVGDSVGDSVRASVGDSVWGSVGASVWASVRDSVWAYTSTFFDVQYKVDMSSVITLWNRGLVASFDGKTWRLHSGKDAKIVYEWKKGKN